MKSIILALILSLVSLNATSQIKEIPNDLFNHYWDCNYAIEFTLQPYDIMEICDMIVTDVWRNYFLRNGKDMMKWHNQHKPLQYSLRKGMLNSNRKDKMI